MDNLAHSLAGALLGETGLKRKTGLGMATLVIAANLPDIDVIGLAFGENLAFRRGWSHGPLGLLLLPLLLVLAMLAFDRWQQRRGTRPVERLPLHTGWLLALAYLGALSHPLLDWLNTYGIRCLAPFSDRWFYGDTLFIIDAWMWAVPALAILAARRRARRQHPRPGRPALLALGLTAVYISAMALLSREAVALTRHAALAQGLSVQDVVANPVPLDFTRRRMIVVIPDAYVFGDLRWRPRPQLVLRPEALPTQMDDPRLTQVRQEKAVADYLFWARLPLAEFREEDGAAWLILRDARYTPGPSAEALSVRVRLPATASSP